ncbi:MAG: glycosyltransferase family 4 protein [Dokdonella sp.]
MADDARLKVLILTNLFPSPWDPRRASFNRQQFERLGHEHDVDVLVAVDFRDRWRGRRGDPAVRNLHVGYFTFFYPPRFGRSVHAFCWLLSLLLQQGWRLRRARYDCLLASWAYPDAVAVSWLARWLKLPYAVKVHGSDLNMQANHALRRGQIARAMGGAGAIVAVSQALADKAVELGVDRARTHTVYNGVDTERFAPAPRANARERLNLPARDPIVLYVGNLKQTKGCVDLLEAFPALLAQRPGALLVFVGEGPARATLLKRSADLGIAQQVQLAGAVAHADLPTWFCSADLLCLPSHNEGVPNVVLEAMACGIPVVATRVGGIPEILPEYAGILVPAQAIEAIGQALVAALAQPWNTGAIVAHARSFRWDDNIHKLESILRDVASRVTPTTVGPHP